MLPELLDLVQEIQILEVVGNSVYLNRLFMGPETFSGLFVFFVCGFSQTQEGLLRFGKPVHRIPGILVLFESFGKNRQHFA